jgi:hypothetical protein
MSISGRGARWLGIVAAAVLVACDLAPSRSAIPSEEPPSPTAASASLSGRIADGCPPPTGDASVDVVLDGFADHDAVFIGEEHGSRAQHALFAQLLCDPRFPATVDVIVVEWGNSRLQGIVDAYVTGGDVSDDQLASVWRESTQGAVWEQGVYRRFFELVRAVNATLPEDERLRVLAGDPPVDRAIITDTTRCDDRDPTCLDHWIFQREESFATATVSALDAGRSALVILGAGHVTSRDDPDAPPSVPEIVEARHPGSTLVLIGDDLISWHRLRVAGSGP